MRRSSRAARVRASAFIALCAAAAAGCAATAERDTGRDADERGETPAARAADECEWAIGGMQTVSRNARAVFAVSTRRGVPVLDALVVVRYDAPVRDTRAPDWPPPPFPRGGQGASVDTLMVVHQASANRVWLHAQPIDLGEDNVVLVDRNAAGDGVPRVVATLHVDPALDPAPTGCEQQGTSVGRALAATIERSAEIQRFLGAQ